MLGDVVYIFGGGLPMDWSDISTYDLVLRAEQNKGTREFNKVEKQQDEMNKVSVSKVNNVAGVVQMLQQKVDRNSNILVADKFRVMKML